MKNKFTLGLLILGLSLILFAGCQTQDQPSTPAAVDNSEPVQMQYLSREELKYAITGMQSDYTVLDVRKKADYDAAHIITSVSADVDAAVSNEDNETATANLEAAIKGAAPGNKFVLLCYSGAKYAEKATQLLRGLGISEANIYTLEGGYNGWTENDIYSRYTYLVEVSATVDDNTFTPTQFLVPRTGDLYISAEELKSLIEAEKLASEGAKISDYYVIDTRHPVEYEKGHLVTAVNSADFASDSNNTFVPRQKLIENLSATFALYPYEEGREIILICRGGKGGAQLMDDILEEEFAISNDLILTLNYGFIAFPGSWSNLGDEYTQYIVAGTEPGTLE